jgi:hypothetical protein
MPKTYTTHDEDIDLIEFLFVLWRGKFLIIFSTILVVLIGSIYFWKKDNIKIDELIKYEGKLSYSINLIRTIDRKSINGVQQVNELFKDLFYSKENFEEWYNSNQQIILKFGDLNYYTYDNGLKTKKTEEQNYINFSKIANSQEYLVFISVDNRLILSEFYFYTEHIIKLLNLELISLLNNDYELLNKTLSRYKNQDLEIPNNTIYELFLIQSILNKIKDGKDIISINYFEVFEESGPIRKLTVLNLIVLSILGIIFGSFIVIIKNSIVKRNRLSKIIEQN